MVKSRKRHDRECLRRIWRMECSILRDILFVDKPLLGRKNLIIRFVNNESASCSWSSNNLLECDEGIGLLSCRMTTLK